MPHELHGGVGVDVQPHDEDFAPNLLLSRSSRPLRLECWSHGPQPPHGLPQPPAWTTLGWAVSPQPAGVTSPPAARADDINSNAAFTVSFLLESCGPRPLGQLSSLPD